MLVFLIEAFEAGIDERDGEEDDEPSGKAEPPQRHETLQRLMQARKLEISDVEHLFGNVHLAREVLAGRRPISKGQAKDGSIYEETTIFSQRGRFRLLSDHVIQRVPSFKQPVDTLIDASTGQVKVRYTEDKDKGKEKVVAQRLELPPDVANGLLFTLMKNIKPSVPQTTVSMVATTPKPRLVKLAIRPAGRGTVHDWKLPS